MTGELWAPLGSSDELLDATGDRAWLQAMLDAERALARAEAVVGTIPPGAADAIAAACDADHPRAGHPRAGHPQAVRLDAGDLGRRGRAGANPVIPLVADLRAAVGPEAATWVHWGATSQDIVDTAAMLVCRRALSIVNADVAGLVGACAALARTHRDTAMVARTLLQHALPTTFGLKAAGWLAAAMDAGDGLDRLRPRLAVQLGGAAGTLAALGDAGPEVMARMAVELDLAEPVVPWHTARGRIAEIAAALAVAAGTAAKIALDVVLMAQNEVGEVSEARREGGGGSSTLPHKRNPAGSVNALAAARRAQGLAGVLLGTMVQAHERAAGAWQAEWATLSDLLASAGGAVATVRAVVEGLEIDTEAMAANLGATAGGVMAERVVIALAPSLGRAQATAAVSAAGRRSGPFAAELAADPVVAATFDEATIADLVDTGGYLGAAGVLVDRALEAYEAWGVP